MGLHIPGGHCHTTKSYIIWEPDEDISRAEHCSWATEIGEVRQASYRSCNELSLDILPKVEPETVWKDNVPASTQLRLQFGDGLSLIDFLCFIANRPR